MVICTEPPRVPEALPRPVPLLRVSVDSVDRRITACGDFDLATNCLLAAGMNALFCLNPGDTVIDALGVTFLDANGLGHLIEFRRRLSGVGATLTITGSPRPLRRLFEVTDLTAHLGVV